MKKLFLLFALAGLFFASCNQQTQTAVEGGNPLLAEYNTPFDMPPFEKIKPEHFIPAYEEGMKQKKAEIEAILTNTDEPTFANTIEPYYYSGALLDKVGTAFGAFSGANTNEEIRAISKEMRPKLSVFHDEIRLDPRLFEKVKKVYENKESFNLDNEQLFLLENLYKGFIRSGADLPEDKKTELMAINKELSGLGNEYSEKILAENNDFELVIDKKEDLKGLPEAVISTAAETATNKGKEGKWVFTISKPSMLPFLTYAENRELREKIYYAYTNKGNNNDEKDTKEIVKKIINLRIKRANLLGYETHAAYRTENRMAQTPERVFNLLDQLWDAILPVAKAEAKELQAMIDKEGGNFKLAPHDWWYYSEKVRKEKYDLDDSELRPYFAIDNVRDGAFAVATKLYGITFEEVKDIPKLHPEVQTFEVKEANGDHIGILTMDFHPRDSKRSGAWCGSYISYHKKNGKAITPLITNVCNFTRPVGDKPALISVDEASTLFHEFGHALDGLFSKRTYPAGYVAWDFVELPSQIMEHWAFEPTVLKMYAKHYETGEIIPDELIEKLQKSGNFNQGFGLTEVLAASLLDMKFHTQTEELTTDVMTFEKEYLEGIGLIPEIYSRYRSTYFGHMIGGYDAAYYAYTWASVLDNDAYAAFKEDGDIFNKDIAASFRENILAKNGIENALEMFKTFRGREPEIDALLENKGLK